MFPSGQDPFGTHLDALDPQAPLPRRVALVRTLMFVGGACGMALSALFLMGLSVPPEAMAEVMREQEGVEVDVATVRAMMVVMAAVTGVYGLLSTLLASRIRRRTLGVFWGVVLFQTAAGALLLWNLLAGDLLAVVPLGFAVAMVAQMLSREGRAHYGLL
ncbi:MULTISPECIES: hypothetical protein [unclassified Nocardiopsis]|uniref:hypothetical protein n=1 Tax=unclassified Nocardiopsis TaxID=2649073 RepID=UPI001356FFB9|nr:MULTISPECIES: hypothetical protein [unclassified Nocardiopsis]